MNRINIGNGKWFDSDAAASFIESTYFDGNNHISKATGSQWNHEQLYRTSSGRWILLSWSQWQGYTDSWAIISDEQAHATWLINNDEDAAAREYFGELDKAAEL